MDQYLLPINWDNVILSFTVNITINKMITCRQVFSETQTIIYLSCFHRTPLEKIQTAKKSVLPATDRQRTSKGCYQDSHRGAVRAPEAPSSSGSVAPVGQRAAVAGRQQGQRHHLLSSLHLPLALRSRPGQDLCRGSSSLTHGHPVSTMSLEEQMFG